MRTRSEGSKVCADKCDARQTRLAAFHDRFGLLGGQFGENTLDCGRSGIVLEALDDGQSGKVSQGVLEPVK